MKLLEIINKSYKHYNQLAKDSVLNQLKLIDDKLFRKKSKHLIVKDFSKRTIWTPQTDLLTFSRRRYFNKNTRQYEYLLDLYLKLDKYKFISKQYQQLAILYFPYFKNYQSLANVIFNKRISKMSIHNFIKAYEPSFKMDSHLCINDGILIINADSLWMKKNRSKKALEIKNLVFFTNRQLNPYTRKYELEGKTLKHFHQESFPKIVKEVRKIILEYNDVREIRLVGDGASWIKKLAKHIGATYYIDKFHYKKYINDLMGRSFINKDLIYHLILQELPIKELRLKLYQLVTHYQDGEITKKQINIIGFLVNNASHYIRNVKYDNPISCIEAMQAHYQAHYFKNQRKGWNIKVLSNLITFLFNHQNRGVMINNDEDDLEDYHKHRMRHGIWASIPGIENPWFAKMIGYK